MGLTGLDNQEGQGKRDSDLICDFKEGTRGPGLCVVSCSELVALRKQAWTSVLKGFWSLSLPPACVEIKSSAFTALHVAAASRGFMEGNWVRSRHAGRSRGSSLKAKSSCRAAPPFTSSLCKCRAGPGGHSCFVAWYLLPRAWSLREQWVCWSWGQGRNGSVGSEFALGSHQFDLLLVLFKLLSQLC